MPPQVLVITGPTASGKTRLGVLLARRLGGEVVSADSMQIYRGMDIGTAKPTQAEMAGIPHHMIDIVDPAEDYSVARYVEQAGACIDGILARGRLPILAGGTGLYIDSLLSGRRFAGGEGPTPLREELGERYDREGPAALWRELLEIDPQSAERLHPNDKKRVLRAIEVYRVTGEPISRHNRETRALPPRYTHVKIALAYRDRQTLYDRIDRRVDDMVAGGLAEEVGRLLWSGLDPCSTAMQAIGYKEMARALSGACTVDEAIEDIKRESRRYAKRQLSWIRRDSGTNWILWEAQPDFTRAVQVSTEFVRGFDIIEPGYK